MRSAAELASALVGRRLLFMGDSMVRQIFEGILAARILDKTSPMSANPIATFTTSAGTFTAEIYLDRVPRTASNFIDLARSGFYYYYYYYYYYHNYYYYYYYYY